MPGSAVDVNARAPLQPAPITIGRRQLVLGLNEAVFSLPLQVDAALTVFFKRLRQARDGDRIPRADGRARYPRECGKQSCLPIGRCPSSSIRPRWRTV
jgi:hypothetical protein